MQIGIGCSGRRFRYDELRDSVQCCLIFHCGLERICPLWQDKIEECLTKNCRREGVMAEDT